MERTPLYLAAIASAAVPGLDPVTVEALPSLPHGLAKAIKRKIAP